MNEEQVANWRDLCNAALTARDPDRLLQIIHQLNAELEREEKARRRSRGVLQKVSLPWSEET
jgi:hypothetical protein